VFGISDNETPCTVPTYWYILFLLCNVFSVNIGKVYNLEVWNAKPVISLLYIDSTSDRLWDCCWYGDNLVASKGWIVCMWFHQEVANHPVVVRPRDVCSLVRLAAMVWLQAAAPVLTLLWCMYAFVLHVTEIPLGFTCSTLRVICVMKITWQMGKSFFSLHWRI